MSRALNLRRAQAILLEAAELAHKADQRCDERQAAAAEDRTPEDIQLELDSMRDAIRRLGWFSDLAATALGAEAFRGGAEQWLLPNLPDVA